MPHSILPHRWKKISSLNRNHLPPNLFAWLSHPASLTAKLRANCDLLKVRVLQQRLQYVRYDEALALNISLPELVIVRDVELICDEKVCVAAHSIFSQKILQGKGAALKKLGSRPLIEILATDPHLKRSTIEIVKLTPGDRDFQRAVLHTKNPPTALWCRRSIFTFFHQPVLVTETFLPAVLELGQNRDCKERTREI